MHKYSFSSNVIIHIDAAPADVWDALVNPDIIKEYLFGTEVISDWEAGSDLIFQGEYEGKKYIDKGKILKIVPEKILKYTYLSSMSDKEDLPENYMELTFTLEEKHDQTELAMLQENVPTQEMATHSEHNWANVLEAMKNIVESQNT